MGQYCCGNNAIKRDFEYDEQGKYELIQNTKKSKNDGNGYESSSTASSESINSGDINPNGDEYEPPNIDSETLLKDFEESIIDKDFQNAMALYEEYWNVDFKNHEFKNGDKALHYAIRQRNSKFAYFMLQKGADPNVISRVTGDTPLHIATRNEDVRMITLLMKWKADTKIKNGSDKSSYEIAVQKNNPDIIEMFDVTFQSFLQERDPTLHNYSKRKDVVATIGKHTGAQKKIKSAWDVDDGGKDEAKIDENTNQRQRKLWKPQNEETGGENDTKKQSTNDNIHHKPQVTVTESEFDDESDDNNEQKGVKPKAIKFLGATKSTIENENNVTDILNKLNNENNNGTDVKTDEKTNTDDRRISLVSDDSSTDIGGNNNNSDNDMDVETQENLVETSLGGSNKRRNSLVIISREQKAGMSSNMESQMKKLKGKQSKAVLTALGSIHQSEVQLPKLGSWLEKRRHKPPYIYQKRFLCVVDGHLLWNDKRLKVNPNASMDSTERKKFSGSLSLMMVKDVYVHESKKSDTWKFEVIAYETKSGNKGKKERIYIWKTKSRKSRDNWVNGIKKHCDHLNNTLTSIDNL